MPAKFLHRKSTWEKKHTKVSWYHVAVTTALQSPEEDLISLTIFQVNYRNQTC